LDAKRWETIRRIYHRALDVDTGARRSFVQGECEDEDLAAQVFALLDVPGTGAAAIDEIVDTATGELRGTLTAGTRIGPYRIIDAIGQGGMGHVYLAERADSEFEQRVAIKIVNWLGASAALIDRFRQERQILVGLEHPNIARMLDGGRTGNGIPYLVMEYIEGEELLEHVERSGLTVEERLRLFLEICDAVQYAHRKLVVHRDIKPSNILVASDGTPKLLDFGIAKFLDAEASADLTRAEARVLTPEYASPEQVLGLPVTTATDVYGLGLLLYRLLTGSAPFDLGNKTAPEIRELICSATPLPPSKAAHNARPAAPASRLQGDLDNIVLMALRKEPERRYDSVTALANDVRNHLQKLPVAARTPSLGYRAGRFVARNRSAVVASAVAIAALVASSSYYTLRLAEERDRARLEADRAEEVAGFLTELFAEADPARNLGEPLTVRQLLDRGASRVIDDLARQPELQATLMVTIAQSYENMQENVAARDYIASALPGIEARLGENNDDILRLRHLWGMVLAYTGDAARAKSVHEENYARQVRLRGEASLEAARELKQLAVVEHRLGNSDTAEDLYLEAIERFRAAGPAAENDLASALIDLGSLLRRADRSDEEERMLLEALEIQAGRVGDRHPDYAAVVNNLGNHYFRRGEFAVARDFMQQNVTLQRELYGDESVPYGTALVNYAALVRREGQEQAALDIYLEALPIFAKGHGAKSPQYAFLLENVANSMTDVGRYDKAGEYYEQALAVVGEHFGTDHPEYAFTLRNRGTSLGRMGRHAEAVPDLEEAIAIWTASHGGAYSRVATTQTTLAGSLLELGRLDAAKAAADAALQGARNAFADHDVERLLATRTAAQVYSALAEFETAHALFREALDVASQLEVGSSEELLETEAAYAASMAMQARLERAAADGER